MSETWTIGELAERAAEALRSSADPGRGVAAPSLNGRVRDVPNERLIRWYTTIGLLDPPLARRGRVALYGARHLAQLVAIKRRQAAGRSIAEIQAELAGATDATLQAIAGLSSDGLSSAEPTSGTRPSAAIASGAPASGTPVPAVPPPAQHPVPTPGQHPVPAPAHGPVPSPGQSTVPPPAQSVVPSPGQSPASAQGPMPASGQAPLPRVARRDTPDRFWARDGAARRPSAPPPEVGSRQVMPLEPPPSEPTAAKPAVTVRPPADRPGPPAVRPGPPTVRPGPPAVHPGPPTVRPGPPAVHPGPSAAHPDPSAAYREAPAERDADLVPELVQGVRLSPSATLLLGPTLRPLGRDDVAAIAATARPLLDALYERGLIDDASREIR